jgi:hypothetical protein
MVLGDGVGIKNDQNFLANFDLGRITDQCFHSSPATDLVTEGKNKLCLTLDTIGSADIGVASYIELAFPLASSSNSGFAGILE